MLANPLPPVRFADWVSPGESLQAFAFCYLASYNDAPLPARVVTAFANAYGVVNLIQVPRVAGAQPGATVAAIQYPWGLHLIIAIEGIKSASQLISVLTQPDDSVFVSNPAGYILALAKTYGDLIWSSLAGNPQFLAWYQAPTTKVTFAGYSLGAAIAEYLAYTHAAINPQNTWKLRKFASPRVGSATWYRNTPDNLAVESNYHWGDNIHMLPTVGQAFASVAGFNLPTGLTPYQIEFGAVRLSGFDHNRYSLRTSNIQDRVNFIAGFLTARVPPAVLPDNVLRHPENAVSGVDSAYYHGMNSMRLLFMCRAQFFDDMAAWRFNFLEFPDENMWQVNAQPSNVWQASWTTITDPGPAPFLPPGQAQAVRLHNANPEPAAPPQNPAQPGLPGGIFNAVDPIIQGGRRRNRHAPVGS